MSYTELESGYQGLRQQNRPGLYVGHDGNIVSYVSFIKFSVVFFPFLSHDMDEFDQIDSKQNSFFCGCQAFSSLSKHLRETSKKFNSNRNMHSLCCVGV